MKSIFTNYDLAVATYRYTVSGLIPKTTKVAWALKNDDIQCTARGMTEQRFLYHLSRASYEKNWKDKYQQPGFGTKVLAFFIPIVPKIGPFRTLSFRTPTPETEKMFEASFNETIVNYGKLLEQQKTEGRVQLLNDNFDTGSVTGPGHIHWQTKPMRSSSIGSPNIISHKCLPNCVHPFFLITVI